MNLIGNIFFALMAGISLLGAIGTVASRNPIRSAVGLLATIIGIAGLFLRLNAEFMAAIQLIVYAGAVVVLFVFVVMLLGPDASKVPDGPAKGFAARVFAGVFMALFSGVAGFLLLAHNGQSEFKPLAPGHGSVEAVGRELFTKAIVPFELTTALLIVAVVGAIAVARSTHAEKKTKPRSDEPAAHRLFHGPLHPRDAGHPLTKERA